MRAASVRSLSNLQAVFLMRTRLPLMSHSTAAFRRRRSCTASLLQFAKRVRGNPSRRAERALCRRIRLRGSNRRAIQEANFSCRCFASAQLTALRTKFRSSCASRSITRKNRSNLASGASLSL